MRKRCQCQLPSQPCLLKTRLSFKACLMRNLLGARHASVKRAMSVPTSTIASAQATGIIWTPRLGSNCAVLGSMDAHASRRGKKTGGLSPVWTHRHHQFDRSASLSRLSLSISCSPSWMTRFVVDSKARTAGREWAGAWVERKLDNPVTRDMNGTQAWPGSVKLPLAYRIYSPTS